MCFCKWVNWVNFIKILFFYFKKGRAIVKQVKDRKNAESNETVPKNVIVSQPHISIFQRLQGVQRLQGDPQDFVRSQMPRM